MGKGRYRCKLSIGESELCCVEGWNRIDVETAAAEEAIQILLQMIVRECNGADPQLVLEAHEAQYIHPNINPTPPQSSS